MLKFYKKYTKIVEILIFYLQLTRGIKVCLTKLKLAEHPLRHFYF